MRLCADPSAASARCRPRDAATVPVPSDGDEALARENPTSRLPDEYTLGLVAHAPPGLARWPALLGQLQVLAPDPAAAVPRLLACHCPDDAGREASLRRREVVVAGTDHRHSHAAALHEVDEGLELPGRAVQSVAVPGHDGVEAPLVDGRQQALVGRPPLAAVGRAVVVLEVVGELPAPVSAEGFAATRWRSTPAR